MISVKKFIDINAHVQNISSEISFNAGVPVALIGFENLGFGRITAIKFDAKGYNAFGDSVQVNGKENFFLIIQDISIDKNTKARDLRVNLPNPEIKKLDLTESQICFADGTVVSYEGENIREFDLEEYNQYGSDEEKLEALNDKLGIKFIYKPVECDIGWICGCGRFNRSGNNRCSSCRNRKDDVFEYTSKEGISKLITAHKESEERKVETDRLEREKIEKDAKKKKIYSIVGSVLAVILACVLVHAFIMSSRTTYSSEDIMKSAVAGVYTYYEDYEPRYQLKVSDNTVTERWVHSNGTLDLDIKSWNPSSGTFTVSLGTITVTNTGNLKYDGKIYEKGGSWSTTSSNSYTSSNSSSNSTNGWRENLEITNLSHRSNGDYIRIYGSVKNNDVVSHTFIQVKVSIKDKEGNTIDTDSTYACGDEGLAPGESTKWEIYFDYDNSYSTCSAYVCDADL